MVGTDAAVLTSHVKISENFHDVITHSLRILNLDYDVNN